MKTLTRAAYVATMDGPIIANGAIVHEGGRIIGVGTFPSVRGEHSGAMVEDLGDAVVLPGLVNAHTHLELTGLGQLPRPDSFVDWVLELRRRMMAEADVEAFVARSTAEGIAQSIRFGVTAVGDITLNPRVTRPLLARSPLVGVSFGEVLGMAGRREQLQGRLDAALETAFDREGFRAGIEPHAPYSLDLPGFTQCLAEAKLRSMPLATHLAETPGEAPFLADHSGPFRRLWEVMGGWREEVPVSPGGPIAAMQQLGVLHYPTVLAHVNYASDSDLDLLAAGRASVVYCPRTHEYFGHPPHRFTEMLDRGINVAIGTDSNASSPDLNLLDDLRLIHRVRPEVPAETLLEMATVHGAHALGMAESIGRLAVGLRADFVALGVQSGNPLEEILESGNLPIAVRIGGRRAEDYAAAP